VLENPWPNKLSKAEPLPIDWFDSMNQNLAHQSGDGAGVVCAREPDRGQIQDPVTVPAECAKEVITEGPPPCVSVIERLPIDDDLHAVEWRGPKLQEVNHFLPMVDRNTCRYPMRQFKTLAKLARVGDSQNRSHNAHHRLYRFEVLDDCPVVFEATTGWAGLFTRDSLIKNSNVRQERMV